MQSHPQVAQGPDPRVGVVTGPARTEPRSRGPPCRHSADSDICGVTLPPGVLSQDLLHQGLAGQDPGLQVRDSIPSTELAVLQGFLRLQLPETKQRTVTALRPV